MNRPRPSVRRAACAAYIHDHLARHPESTREAALALWRDMSPGYKVMRYRAAAPFVDAVLPTLEVNDTDDLPVGSIVRSIQSQKVFTRVKIATMGEPPYIAFRWVSVDTGAGSVQLPILIDRDGPFELLHRPEAH